MLSCFVFVLMAYLVPIVDSSSRQLQVEAWNREINESLARNIKRECKWQMLNGLSLPQEGDDSLYVSTFLPSKAEVYQFQRLPSTLTLANAAMGETAVKRGFGYDKRASEKGPVWQIPLDHPGQNASNCFDLTMLAAKENVLDMYNSYKSIHRTFYISRGRNAVVHPNGAVGFACGHFQAQEACETRWEQTDAWWTKCNTELSSAGLSWKSLWSATNSSEKAMAVIEACTIDQELGRRGLNITTLFRPHKFRRVFVITALWDFNYHHFIADSLARLVRNLRFLLSEPDVYIHVRAFEEYDIQPVRGEQWKREFREMRDRLFTLLGIDLSRIVHGTVVAEEVYVPRNMHCSYTLSNPMEIR